MPELPEVETTVQGLRGAIIGKAIKDAWADNIKSIGDFSNFKNSIKGEKITKISRVGKNIIIELSSGRVILIHQKMTGHLLLGRWKKEGKRWLPESKGPLCDWANLYIRLILFLGDGLMVALSDIRRFAKVELYEKADFLPLKKIGPDPLEISFAEFKKKFKKKRGGIKKALMNQEIVSGIGNIYSDEILWKAKMHPLKEIKDLQDEEFKKIFLSAKTILKKALKMKGDSMSDYRTVTGEKGGYQKNHKAYRRQKMPCPLCGEKIKRIKIGGRSAHFCPKCQKL